MKLLSAFKFAVCATAITLLFGCQKESLTAPEKGMDNLNISKAEKKNKLQEHQLKGEYTSGTYNFIPDEAAGYVSPNPAPGWYHGTATVGHLNLLGKSKGFVNMYATFGPNGLQGVAAPLNMFFADELQDLGIVVPDAVAIIFYDEHGNSIWARGVGTIPITPVSATKVLFNVGNAVILGGTGKFANATGSFSFSGYFNPQDYNDVGLEVTDGTIVF